MRTRRCLRAGAFSLLAGLAFQVSGASAQNVGRGTTSVPGLGNIGGFGESVPNLGGGLGSIGGPGSTAAGGGFASSGGTLGRGGGAAFSGTGFGGGIPNATGGGASARQTLNQTNGLIGVLDRGVIKPRNRAASGRLSRRRR